MALRDACEAAGFAAQGTEGIGIKINRDCMDPLLNGVVPPGNGKLPLPMVSKKVVAECKAAKTKGGKKTAAKACTVATVDAPVAAKPLPQTAEAGPNIVLVLVDDLSMNLMADDLGELAKTMPNLAQIQREGLTFDNFFVTNSLCCPSRASILTGLLPHETGVLTNTGATGGVGAFDGQGNDGRTFAVALHEAFYATAMMGKYLNGYDIAASGIPAGWSEWAVGGNAYSNFNDTLNHNGAMISPELHLTDQISELGQAFITGASSGPFFLELAPYSVHAPYAPPACYATLFAGLTYPRSPAFAARPDEHAPQWLQDIPPLDKRFIKKIDDAYRMRMQSLKGIDDMVGDIRGTIEELGLTEDTYVFFTSDNGYHMGNIRCGRAR